MAKSMKSILDQFYENLNRVKDFSEASEQEASNHGGSTDLTSESSPQPHSPGHQGAPGSAVQGFSF